jgi:ribonuclease BN (tRNA processing enzyme)
MKIIFTGTASGFPVSNRRCTSILVQRHGAAVLLDAGEGVFAGLLEQNIVLDAFDSIWISHTHADHVSGLPMLLQGMHLGGRTAPLTIHVPPARESWFRDWLQGMYIFEEKWSYTIRFEPFAEDGAMWGDLRLVTLRNSHLDRVRTLAADHGVPADSYSFRLEAPEGRVLISSDIGGMDDVAAEAVDASVLVIDSTHVPIEDIHALAEHLPGLDVICTHIPPELEAFLQELSVRSVRDFGGRIRYAHDGMEYNLEHAA